MYWILFLSVSRFSGWSLLLRYFKFKSKYVILERIMYVFISSKKYFHFSCLLRKIMSLFLCVSIEREFEGTSYYNKKLKLQISKYSYSNILFWILITYFVPLMLNSYVVLNLKVMSHIVLKLYIYVGTFSKRSVAISTFSSCIR